MGFSALDDRLGDGGLGSVEGIVDFTGRDVLQPGAVEFCGGLGDVLCDVTGEVQAAALSEHIVSVAGGICCGLVMAFALGPAGGISESTLEGAWLVIGRTDPGGVGHYLLEFSVDEYLDLAGFDRVCRSGVHDPTPGRSGVC